MKGVIVQVGNPKSIVLFNNGKISAIPTPAEAHVGMVVSIRLNSRIKILSVVFSVILFLLIGISIGIFVSRNNKKTHGQYSERQVTERIDNSDYSFQKGKEENK